MTEPRRIALRSIDGVDYKFFADYKSLIANAPVGPFEVGNVLLPEHPDPEVTLEYEVIAARAPDKERPFWLVKGALKGDPPRWEPRDVPRTHDYTFEKLTWGHSIGCSKGAKDPWYGWGSGIRPGDFILLTKPGLQPTVVTCRVERVTYADDPADMWFASLIEQPHAP